MRSGERITERQALQAVLLPSANNIAVLLAIHDAGTLAAFVARMNTTARLLRMRSTTYTDPSGFNPETTSTASDQLRLARVAMRDPTFATIVAEPAAVLPVAGRIANINALVGTDGYVGVKTGSDSAAGGCLVFAKQITVAGRHLTVLGAVLGQHQGLPVEAALAAARRLGDSLASAVHLAVVVPAGTRVLSASSADGRHTTAVTATALREIGWGGLRVPVGLTVHVPSTGPRAGEPIATVSVAGVAPASSAAVSVRGIGAPSLRLAADEPTLSRRRRASRGARSRVRPRAGESSRPDGGARVPSAAPGSSGEGHTTLLCTARSARGGSVPPPAAPRFFAGQSSP